MWRQLRIENMLMRVCMGRPKKYGSTDTLERQTELEKADKANQVR